MADERKISFIGITMRRSTYIVVQICCVGGLLILGGLSYLLFREAELPALRYAWIVFLAGALLEVVEAAYVLTKRPRV